MVEKVVDKDEPTDLQDVIDAMDGVMDGKNVQLKKT